MGGGFGWGVYVASSKFAADGRPVNMDLGNTFGAVVTYRYEDGTNRLSSIDLNRERISGSEIDLTYTYDPAGNVSSVKDLPTNENLQADTSRDQQCFGYDELARLDTAWTPTNGDCEQGPSTFAMGGAAPYWNEYEYDLLGNRTKLVTRTATGTTTTDSVYGSGDAGPHQLTSSTTGGAATTYTYDDAGNRTTKTPNTGDATNYAWDAEGELTSTSGVKNVYDADGNRLVREDTTGTTVYLGGQEILITPTGDVKATRYYQFAGKTVAIRTDRGLNAVTSLMTDHHGTPVAAIPNGGNPTKTPVKRMYTDPFGGTRGSSNAATVPGDIQFLGKNRDTGTGLTLLGARYYDETAGAFISVDPILDLTDPQQWNGYAYANNNPSTLSDPSGLRPEGMTGKEWVNQLREQSAAKSGSTPTVDPPVRTESGGGHGVPPARPGGQTVVPDSEWLHKYPSDWTGCETALFNGFSSELRCIPKNEEATVDEILTTAADLFGGIAGARSSNGKPRAGLFAKSDPVTGASIQRDLDAMMPGRTKKTTRLLGTPEEVHAQFAKWIQDGTKIDEGVTRTGHDFYKYEIPDGTTVQLRMGSGSVGPAIDVTYVDKKSYRVHVNWD